MTAPYEPESVYEEGRGLPFSQLGDWVNHAGISDRAARIYWTLCEHLNAKRGDRAVWPAQSVIAKVLGIKRAADVAPAIDELVVIGAVEIRPDYDDHGRRVRNRYIIHRTPEDGYVGPRSLTEFYRLLRLDDGMQYDAWFKARRQEIADGVERLKRERQEADQRAKEDAKRRALGGAESRTSTPPAKTRNAAGRVGVRDSSRAGAGFRTAGVRDSAPEQYEVEPDEDLSLPAVAKRAAAPAAPKRERETAAPDNDATQVALAWRQARGGAPVRRTEAAIAAQAAQLLADGHQIDHLAAVAAWMAGRGYTDLERALTHREAPKPAAVVAAGEPGRTALPDWCGECNDHDPAARFNPRLRIARDGAACPACHPNALVAA